MGRKDQRHPRRDEPDRRAAAENENRRRHQDFRRRSAGSDPHGSCQARSLAEDDVPHRRTAHHFRRRRRMREPCAPSRATARPAMRNCKKQLAEFDSLKPAPLPDGQFMIDIGANAPPTYVLHARRSVRQGRRSAAGLPLDPRSRRREDHAASGLNSTGRRTALAAG